ncbi:PREDICTED: protein POF1B [Chrysochloris asiatica]|uniref:Protein POF1B n=1 Tax=Chrysochloris asiatica TaxID=185453 RepID=A0A9B0TWI1_CHRAS|nr:PREDICTED: protein POF1B [Chrysochloris asiatica]
MVDVCDRSMMYIHVRRHTFSENTLSDYSGVQKCQNVLQGKIWQTQRNLSGKAGPLLAAARPAPAAAQGEHLRLYLLTIKKMISSAYWSETSSSSCGTQQSPEVLQCQPQHYHCYHQSSTAQQPPETNVVYERVRTYSGPMNKVVQALDPIGSREVLSPLETTSSSQNLVWSDHSQELHSPTLNVSTCTPNTLHITQNTDQELHSPTMKVTAYPQTTIRRYIVQNPELEPLSPFIRGGHFFPGNNVIYEKTIRKVEKLNTDQGCHPQVQCHQHHIVQQPQIIHSPHYQQSHSTQQIQTITESDSISTNTGNELCHGGSSHIHEQVIIQDAGPEKLDPKYFGELLADLSRKNMDLYHCLLEHLQRIGGSKYDTESTDESEDIESLIPKGLSEFTKQQIRYILQMRGISDKSLRLVLSTFSNIREELGHLQHDLTSLENDKLRLEKDLSFKETQIKEYDELLTSVRANNRQQQQGLQDSSSKCQALEENNLSLRHTLSDLEYKLKELEYCRHNLEQENKNLRMQVSETCTGPMLQAKMDEIGSHYMEMVKNLRTEKDREICKLRTQLNQYQKDVSRREGSCSDFQSKLHELTSLLEEKDSLIKRQSEELSKLRQEMYSSHNQPCSGGRTTITTKKYRTQYPILGLLYDDYEYIPPGSDTQTIVIEKTEDKWACVSNLEHF